MRLGAGSGCKRTLRAATRQHGTSATRELWDASRSGGGG